MNTIEEKEFTFVKNRGGSNFEYVTKKESELTQQDLDLLASHILYDYNKLPNAAQEIIKNKINE